MSLRALPFYSKTEILGEITFCGAFVRHFPKNAHRRMGTLG